MAWGHTSLINLPCDVSGSTRRRRGLSSADPEPSSEVGRYDNDADRRILEFPAVQGIHEAN
jgi:hypothetical protein